MSQKSKAPKSPLPENEVVLAVRISKELRAEIWDDAKELGVRFSDAARIRLRNGRVPTLEAR